MAFSWTNPYRQKRDYFFDLGDTRQFRDINRLRGGRYGNGYGANQIVLPHGGGPYSGSGGQQFQQGLGDVFAALTGIMQQRQRDRAAQVLLQQYGPQYQNLVSQGLTPEQALQEAQNDVDAQEAGQQLQDTHDLRRAQIEKL